jgi:flagellin-like hook-associated protein FlgL
MAHITLSPATRTTLLQVLRTQALMDATAKRLATGVRASANTNAAAFVKARSLTGRAVDLLGIKDNISTAAITVGVAGAAIKSIISLVDQMRALALSVKGGAVSGAVATTVTGDVVTDVAQTVTTALAGAEDNDSFDITYNGTTTTIVNENGDTFTDISDKINAISGLTATVSDGNSLIITAADGQDIVITNNVTDLATDLGLATSTNGTLATNTLRAAAETQFDMFRMQIDYLVSDTTFLGVNLLKALPDSLFVNFNEDGTASLTVSGIASDSTALGISAVDSADSFATDTSIDTIVAQLDAALTTLGSTQSTLGGNNTLLNIRLTFTENLINTLAGGVAKLINADLNAEGANLLALRTRNDLALGAMSLSLNNGSAVFALLQLS